MAVVTLTATWDSLHGPLHPRVCVVLVGTDASRPTDGKAEPAAHHLQRGAEHSYRPIRELHSIRARSLIITGFEKTNEDNLSRGFLSLRNVLYHSMLATLRTTSNALCRSITSFAGQPIQCKAAVARGVNDLRIEEITVRF